MREIFADSAAFLYDYTCTCIHIVLECFTGCMIDIVNTKGQAGFTAFLEVVEYEYPELFVEITGKEARMPPRGDT